MRRRLRLFTFFSLFAALLFTEACSRSQEAPVRTAEEVITLKKEAPTKGVDLFLLIDESGSMYGEKGTDPQGLRYEAGKYLVQNLLVKEADPTFPHRIAVIHFGDVAVAHPFAELLPANAEELAQRVPHTEQHLGDTSFIKALQEVRKVAEATPHKNRREPIIVIFTDGEPDDRRRLSLTEYFREIGQFRQEHLPAVKLYVIGIDKTPDHAKWMRSQQLWEAEVGEENVFFITDMKELYAKYNEVVRSIFEIPEVSPDVVTEEVTFEVQPYLDRIEFHVFPESKELKLGIVRPNQTPVQAGDTDVSLQKGEGYDILTLSEPAPGSWKYRILEGKGRILVLRNPVPFKLQLLELGDTHPLGKPLLLKARFTKGEGIEIKEHPNYPLAFTAKVIAPKKEETNIQFLDAKKIGEGYYADRVVPIQDPGKYLIKLTVKGGTRFETISTREIFVHSYPYLEVLTPTSLESYPLSDDFTVEVALRRDDADTDPAKEFENHPNVLVLAQLKDSPYATQSPAIWLNYDEGNGIFRGVIPHEFRNAGLYAIAVQLAGTPRVSDQLRPSVLVEQVDFRIEPSRGQQAERWASYAAVAVVIGGILWGASFTVWFFRLPRMTASIQVLREGDVVLERYINGRFLRPTRIPGDGKIWVRARDDESLYVFRKGFLSFFSGGLVGRRFLVRRNEERDLDAIWRVTWS